MPDIEVKWLNDEQKIIIWEFEETWDWGAFHHATETSREMADSVEHNVVEILDFQRVKMLAPNLVGQGQLSLYKDAHPRLKATIAFSANAYFNGLFKMIVKILPSSMTGKWNIIFVESLEEAYAEASKWLDSE